MKGPFAIIGGIRGWSNSKEEGDMPIQAGMLAPDFTLEDETGAPRTLSAYRGKPVVLYFYPKDDTPGCTKEACAFRDDYSVYRQAGVVILGVSPDTPKSHAKFKEKYSLPFTLLADEGHKVCDLYGVWGPKKLMGKEYEGVLRTTFLIDPNGEILRVFENVKPDGHSQEILGALEIGV
jgi:peroxiredoxin Q/BCP